MKTAAYSVNNPSKNVARSRGFFSSFWKRFFDSESCELGQLDTPEDNSIRELPTGTSDVIDLITVKRFCRLTGYSDDAVRAKMANGVWLQGAIWIKAPDGRILISIKGYETWARGDKPWPER